MRACPRCTSSPRSGSADEGSRERAEGLGIKPWSAMLNQGRSLTLLPRSHMPARPEPGQKLV